MHSPLYDILHVCMYVSLCFYPRVSTRVRTSARYFPASEQKKNRTRKRLVPLICKYITIIYSDLDDLHFGNVNDTFYSKRLMR